MYDNDSRDVLTRFFNFFIALLLPKTLRLLVLHCDSTANLAVVKFLRYHCSHLWFIEER
ncbi:hypothetical protein BT96DRAFT_917625 [Gymnopus androsaceus JB14]|uniref:Uncharacterized protein n=1 Tax=Gymnopus androsaceus JB14 TaxID=1447944 RepID=A0A6A4I1U1_9AGAR|nr:hypothetical protein BT96DRAFT_917625 [Gymnopus androsaceus JB14]